MNKKETVSNMKKLVVMLALALMPVLAFSKTSTWKEIQTVVIPQNVTINEGVTKSGNPKYWIEIESIKVSVSEGNAKKFRSGEVKLELVKWKSEEGKIKYSTRQVKSSSSSKVKDVDLVGLFK